jgi:ribonucleotide monophosphatase NagD (HAD superfamily)
MQSELLDNSMGDLELNVGSWVGLLERAAGVAATYIGKPNPFVFELALQDMHLSKHQVLMVGDRVETDIRGAQDFGLRSVLVQPASSTPASGWAVRPDFSVINPNLQPVLEVKLLQSECFLQTQNILDHHEN